MDLTLSLFYARFFGIYFLIFAFLWIFRQVQMKEVIKEIFSKPPILVIAGSLSLMLGIAIVVSHDVYEWNWRGFITLLGYLAILKGVLRLGFPKHARDIAFSLIKGASYWICFLILLVFGIWLTYVGFNLSL